MKVIVIHEVEGRVELASLSMTEKAFLGETIAWRCQGEVLLGEQRCELTASVVIKKEKGDEEEARPDAVEASLSAPLPDGHIE